MPQSAPPSAVRRTDVIEALLSASRALVGLAARSLTDADVTLPQYRALVVIDTRGPQRVVDIATELGVNPSTGTRMCDRLVRKGLACRTRSTMDRRVVLLSLTPAGRELVGEVTSRRRAELTGIVDAMPEDLNEPLVSALNAFTALAGEPRLREWWLGWPQKPVSGSGHPGSVAPDSPQDPVPGKTTGSV